MQNHHKGKEEKGFEFYPTKKRIVLGIERLT